MSTSLTGSLSRFETCEDVSWKKNSRKKKPEPHEESNSQEGHDDEGVIVAFSPHEDSESLEGNGDEGVMFGFLLGRTAPIPEKRDGKDTFSTPPLYQDYARTSQPKIQSRLADAHAAKIHIYVFWFDTRPGFMLRLRTTHSPPKTPGVSD